jgi:hypothetical protein
VLILARGMCNIKYYKINTKGGEIESDEKLII